jgi:hypothetical protein
VLSPNLEEGCRLAGWSSGACREQCREQGASMVVVTPWTHT